MVTFTGKTGFINANGIYIVPAQYEKATSFQNGIATVRSSGKWSYIDTKGKVILPAKYDMASAFNSDGTAEVRIGKDRYRIDRTGKILEELKSHEEQEEMEHHK